MVVAVNHGRIPQYHRDAARKHSIKKNEESEGVNPIYRLSK